VTSERARWRARPDGLRLGSSLVISFQRYLVVDAPRLPAIPKSLGAVGPARTGRDRYIVPLHAGEAVWLGIEFLNGTHTIQLAGGDQRDLHEITIERSLSHGVEMIAALPGLPGALRFGPSSGQCAAIDLVPRAEGVGRARVAFVNPATFRQRTGRDPPRPARRDDGYGDWRLP
jgi:hypothetical protein